MPSDSSKSHTANQLQSAALACRPQSGCLPFPRAVRTPGAAKGKQSRVALGAAWNPRRSSAYRRGGEWLGGSPRDPLASANTWRKDLSPQHFCFLQDHELPRRPCTKAGISPNMSGRKPKADSRGPALSAGGTLRRQGMGSWRRG